MEYIVFRNPRGGFGCDELVLYDIRLLLRTVLNMELNQSASRAETPGDVTVFTAV